MINDFDDRMSFYVQHHTVIDEWVRLANDWRVRIDDFLKSQAESISSNAPDSSSLIDYPDEKHRKIFLYKPEWEPRHESAINNRNRYPFTAIGIEWVKDQLDILSDAPPRKQNLTTPYCGVFVMNRVQPDETRQPDRFRDLLKTEMKQHDLLARKYNEKAITNWWPLQRFLAIDRNPLESTGNGEPDIESFLDGIETVMQEGLHEAWNDLHGIVDRVLSKLESSDP